MFKKTMFGPTATTKKVREDGSVLLKLEQKLEVFPERITEKLILTVLSRKQK